MALSYEDLDDQTRRLMLEEVERDRVEAKLYLSKFFNEDGQSAWPNLLTEAAESGSDESLAQDLRSGEYFVSHHERRTPSGGTTMARVPATAPDTLAEGEFNRFYARAVCRRAIDAGVGRVEVYRAKEVAKPRAESEALLGTEVDAQELLGDLRINQGVDTALGVPAGPNSGLSIRLPSNVDE